MTQNTWQQQQHKTQQRMANIGVTPSLVLADPCESSLLALADFDVGEGDYGASPYLKLNMCTAHIGRMGRFGDGPSLEGVLRPGTVAIALPNTPASGFWSKTQMLGITIDLNKFMSTYGAIATSDRLFPSATTLHTDPLLTAVMTALWRDAECHGLSSLFFEQGIAVLLKHLANYRCKAVHQATVYPLRGQRLQQVLDLVESRVGSDVRVIELAALAKQDTRTFTRSFFAATGFAPYEYFTLRRMAYAQQLLSNEILTITEIAQQVGYANPSKFSAAFRRVYGVTPSRWRRQSSS